MTMGLSMALYEESAMDPRISDYPNHDLAGYHIAAHADVQDIDAVWIEEEEPDLGPANWKSAWRWWRRPPPSPGQFYATGIRYAGACGPASTSC